MFERGKCAGIDGVVTKHDSTQKKPVDENTHELVL